MKNIFFAFFTLLFIVSCNKSETVQTVKIKNQYSIELPESLSKTNDLNDDASLQYQNLYDEFYIIVIDEKTTEIDDLFTTLNKKLGLTSYVDFIKTDYEKGMKSPVFSGIKKGKIHGLESQIISISGRYENMEVFYKIAFLKSEKYYYQVMLWTLLDKKEEHEKEMDKVIASFKEIKTVK